MNKVSKKGNRNHPRDAAEERLAKIDLACRPPPLHDQLSSGLTLRFVTNTTATTALSVSYTNLLDAWLIAGTATIGYQLFDFVKIRRVTVRAMSTAAQGASQGGAVTLGIEFPGLNSGQLGSGKQISQTFLGTANPAMVTLKPDPKSQGAQWQPTSGSSAFFIRSRDQLAVHVIGMIIDVELSWKNSGDINPAVIAQAIAGATPGSIYFGGLDGNRLAATGYPSVFIPTI